MTYYVTWTLVVEDGSGDEKGERNEQRLNLCSWKEAWGLDAACLCVYVFVYILVYNPVRACGPS